MQNPGVHAVLLTAPGCPHCAAMKRTLQDLEQQGFLARLEIIDLSVHPDVAGRYGVRSVPWCEIGRFELTGLHNETELKQWVELAGRPGGMRHYMSELLGSGQLAAVERVLRRYPDELPALLELMQDPEQSINVQIGIGALFESLQGEAMLLDIVPALGDLSRHPEARVRSDACHYLGLCGGPKAASYLKAAMQDENPDVREIAKESLVLIEGDMAD